MTNSYCKEVLPCQFQYSEDYSQRGRGFFHYYKFDVLASGKGIRKTPTHLYYADYTPLRTCCNCGKVSTPKKVQYRAFFGGVYGKISMEHGNYCVGCFNQIKVMDKKYNEAMAIDRINNQVKKLKKDKQP